MNQRHKIAWRLLDDYEQCQKAFQNILKIEGSGMFSFLVRETIQTVRSRIMGQLEVYRSLIADKMGRRK